MSIVIAMRDPDASNEFRTFGDPVEIIDVDYGRADLSNREEFAEWEAGHWETVNDLFRRHTTPAKAAAYFLVELIWQARENFGHDS